MRWISINAAPFVGFEIHHGLAELNAGVVDEDVDVDAGGVEMLESRENRFLIGDVEGVRFDLMPSVGKRLGGLRQLLLVAAIENDCGARRRETPRHRQPKTVRGSGDESRLAAEIEKLGCVHPLQTYFLHPASICLGSGTSQSGVGIASKGDVNVCLSASNFVGLGLPGA